MVKEKLEFDVRKMGDVQKDVIHYERLISDLIGILSKSISFCIHSGESINELVKQSVRNCETVNDKNGEDPNIIIQEPSFFHKYDINMNNNDNGIDYIQFTSNGPLYSLPKRITNSLFGTYLYEQSQESQRTVEGNIYLDYPNDETFVPLVIDSLMNKKIDINQFEYKEQYELLKIFEFCEVPLPEEMIYTYKRSITKLVKYEDTIKVDLYINGELDTVVTEYLKNKNEWDTFVKRYKNGFIDYNHMNEHLSITKNYQYIDYIYSYIKTNTIDIETNKIHNIQKDILIAEMNDVFCMNCEYYVNQALLPFKVFIGTQIITNKVMESPLLQWYGQQTRWKLLFRASEHDYLASEFHKYCDNKGETITIVKCIDQNNRINIFGGYTNQSWDCEKKNNCYAPYYHYRLFTLVNVYNIPKETEYYTGNNTHIVSDPLLGPTFSGDIRISDRCHSNNDSYICLQAFNRDYYYSYSYYGNNQRDPGIHVIVDDYEVWGRC
ncbi:hypothetical protein WA158_006496 [Blastocystis sp. Blastoise]